MTNEIKKAKVSRYEDTSRGADTVSGAKLYRTIISTAVEVARS